MSDRMNLDQQVKQLHQAGHSDAEIGIRLGIDSAAAKRRRTALGLPANKRFRRTA